jgi:CDP-diacylglycerol--serine O-phosphatidyltransferase
MPAEEGGQDLTGLREEPPRFGSGSRPRTRRLRLTRGGKGKEPRRRKGVFIFPTMLTLGNIYFGFSAMMLVFNHHGTPEFRDYLVKAAHFLIAAAFLDMIDGKVARATGTSSEFGVQIDSLADVISFGLAPGFLAYAWALHPQRRLGWLPAFLFLICGAIRLARFNVQTKTADKRHFTGLPIPAAAMLVVTMILVFPELEPKSLLSYAVTVLLYATSFLMVSRIQYPSFKEIDFRAQRPIRTILLIAIFLAAMMYNHRLMLLIIAFSYALSGVVTAIFPQPFEWIKRLARKAFAPIAEVEDVEEPEDAEEAEGGPEDEESGLDITGWGAGSA